MLPFVSPNSIRKSSGPTDAVHGPGLGTRGADGGTCTWNCMNNVEIQEEKQNPARAGGGFRIDHASKRRDGNKHSLSSSFLNESPSRTMDCPLHAQNSGRPCLREPGELHVASQKCRARITEAGGDGGFARATSFHPSSPPLKRTRTASRQDRLQFCPLNTSYLEAGFPLSSDS